jgi:hypothetical protein
MTLEPLIDGLVGDAEGWVMGEPGHNAGHAELADPSAEVGLPAVRGSLEAPARKGHVAKHLLRRSSWCLHTRRMVEASDGVTIAVSEANRGGGDADGDSSRNLEVSFNDGYDHQHGKSANEHW